jgi:hypothetical protein
VTDVPTDQAPAPGADHPANGTPTDRIAEGQIIGSTISDGTISTGGRTANAGFEPKADEVTPGSALMPTMSSPNLSLNARIRYARELANANLLPSQYRGAPANVLYAVEYGLMLGIAPMAAITGIHVIDGKPTASAALMSALVRRAGHKMRMKVEGSVEGGDLKATAYLIRSDDPDWTFEATWTIDRAVRAGLVDSYQQGSDGKWTVRARTRNDKPGNWETYPEAMAKARAISEVVREGAEEVLAGAHYTAEELGALVDEDGSVIDGEVVETLSQPAAAPEPPQPFLPAKAEQIRKIVLAAFTESADPAARRQVILAAWEETGPPERRVITPVRGLKGEETNLDAFLRAAAGAVQSGQPFTEEQAPAAPEAPAAEQPVEAAQEAAPGAEHEDGTVEAEVVPEPASEPESAPEEPRSDDPVNSSPLVPADDPAGPPPVDPEQGRTWLLDEIDVLATIHGTTVSKMTQRQRAHLKREVKDWTAEEALRFVAQYRKSAVDRLGGSGKTGAAQAYDMLGTSVVADVRAMLGDALPR